jgi:hypothetical protein
VALWPIRGKVLAHSFQNPLSRSRGQLGLDPLPTWVQLFVLTAHGARRMAICGRLVTTVAATTCIGFRNRQRCFVVDVITGRCIANASRSRLGAKGQWLNDQTTRGARMMKSANEKSPPVLQRDDRGAVAILTLNRPDDEGIGRNRARARRSRHRSYWRWTRLQCWRRHRGLSTLPGGKSGASHREIRAARPSDDAAR